MNSNFTITRYPTTDNRSLKAWSAADDFILTYLKENELFTNGIKVYNDRFGYLSIHLYSYNPICITTHSSQEKSIIQNAKDNGIDINKITFENPLSKSDSKSKITILKIPKSMDLFRLFLIQIHKTSSDDSIVICSFMTKYFTKKMIEIAGEYFSIQEQSKAWKKSRLLILSKPTKTNNHNTINAIKHTSIKNEEIQIKQYFGVFSAKHIDYATQFLIENIELDSNTHRVLDVASGNGILAKEISSLKSDVELTLIDDSYLANASAALNLADRSTTIHYDNNLDQLEDNYYDLVVCNPPFHFEHENTIDIALELFRGIERVMHTDGRFLCVANLHLNYKTHLTRIFEDVDIYAMNGKFVVYDCWK